MKVAENGLTDIECPYCAFHVHHYCNGNHRVYERFGGRIVCEFCGGEYRPTGYIRTRWSYKCGCCGKKVKAGELHGLFVPHNCKECQDTLRAREEARGSVCYRCRKVYSECAC